jgi:hypothetical protein
MSSTEDAGLDVPDYVTAIVALEDTASDLLSWCDPTTGLPVWPLLRVPLSRELMRDEIAFDPPSFSITAGEAGRYLLGTALGLHAFAGGFRDQRDVLFVTTGLRRTRTAAGLRDQVIGDYAADLGDRAAIAQFAPLVPDDAVHPSTPRTRTLADQVLRSEFAARFRPPSSSALAAIRAQVDAILDHLDWEVRPDARTRLLGTVEARARRLPTMQRGYERLLARTRPRLVLLQEAVYGAQMALTVAAHRLGIHVAEPQHGLIGPAHAAYNFGAAMSTGVLRETLPDTLLTFGEFWSRGLRVPFDTVPIGKSQLSARRDAAAPLAERAKTLVVIGGGHEPDETAAATLRARAALPADWRVLFRPHPFERPTVRERYRSLIGVEGIELDLESDVLETLGRARAVLGTASTVLYEAIGLGCEVIVRRSERLSGLFVDLSALPEPIADGPALTTRVAALAAGPAAVDESALEALWSPDPRTRFASFAAAFRGDARDQDREHDA